MRATTRFCIWMILLVLLSMQSFGLGLASSEREFRYTADQTSSIKFLVIRNASRPVTLNFDFVGDLANQSNFRIPHYWYSTKSDLLNVTLQREFDLRDVTSASLRFYTKYDIEYGWDFGYIELSSNNGTSWIHLNTTGTTTYVDPYYHLHPGDAPRWYDLELPALTGSVSDWTLETSNISPFVGNIVLIRFRYVTDDLWSEHGWLIDDISVPEIGFFDNLESGNKNWSTDSWLHNVIYMNDSANITPIFIDFVIPDNYSSNASDQKLIAMELSGYDGNYNPTQTAVPFIVAKLPPLVKIIPTQPSGGGGGGSYSARYGNEFTYFDNLIEAGITNRIDTSTSNTPLKSVELQLLSTTHNVGLKVTPLFTKPDEIKDTVDGVYSYFRIDVKNLEYSSIKNALLKIYVTHEWLLSNKAKPDDIVVGRFSGGKLQDLDTKMVGISGNSYIYETNTPGFSIFVVRIKSQIKPKISSPVNQSSNKSISLLKPLTIVTGNESAQKVIDDIKRRVQVKTNATKEDVDKFFDENVLLVSKAKSELPKAEKPIFSRIILYSSMAVISAILMVALIVVLMRRRRPKMIKSERKELI